MKALNGGIQLIAAICTIGAAFAAAYMWDHGLIGQWPGDYDDDDDPLATDGDPTELCPLRCGRTTEDPDGGPCHDCWNRVS